ncbi:hypothetical protein LJC69_05755 [Bacteroidales bacterium OttesenSCG-928-K22]|nr:hypothetical protein [Bacteroidales bacterium OttesenSCG-928-L14]MDL2241113.1 hypothetical protein [Bacteroidales bacterium OttesenSCG-928-K22]
MKKKTIKITLTLSIIMFISCVHDYQGSYSFLVKNTTQKTITLKFINHLDENIDINKDEITILPDEERVVRIITADLGIFPLDRIESHFMEEFSELIFDTYVNNDKLDKQLWQPENWIYYEKSEWESEYKMTIINEML